MERKKRLKMPGSVVILFLIICFVTVLTYVIPAGQFDTVTNPQTGASVVDPASFHSTEQSPVSPFRMFVGIQRGFIDGGNIIFLILFGYFWVYSILQTGAFTAMINKLLGSRVKDSKWFIPIIMTVFALAGSTYGENETVYGLIPIFVALALAMAECFGYFISREAVLRYREKDPSFFYKLLTLFLGFCARIGIKKPDGYLIPLELTHQLISEIIHVNHVTISRFINLYQKKGCLIKEDKYFKVNVEKISEIL